jgi:methionyl aminopeptidase
VRSRCHHVRAQLHRKRELARAKALSAFLDYRRGVLPPYPAVLCTWVNCVVVHGIPSKQECLREGDLIGIDFACFKDGYCADAARTVAVGVISEPARALLEATRACLDRSGGSTVRGSGASLSSARCVREPW